jgi:hypothetical protein
MSDKNKIPPNLAAMKAARPMTSTAQEFIEWLREQKGVFLAYTGARDIIRPVDGSIDDLLAEWQGLDLEACERERQEILDNL